MTSLPDPYRRAASRAGAAFVSLVRSPGEWVHRRVEAIDLLTFELVRRQVSVDFTVPAGLREDLSVPDIEQQLVPIATLRKQPLRNFDLRDEDKRAIPVLGREHDGMLAWATLLSAATHVLGATGLSEDIAQRLRVIAYAPPDEASIALAQFAADAAGDAQLASLLADQTMRLLLGELAENYLLVAVIAGIDRRRVLKFGYDSYYSPLAVGWRERLGWQPLVVGLTIPSAARAASFHAEVVLPEELRSVGAIIVDEASGDVLGRDAEADRVAIHAPEVSAAAEPELLVGVAAERAGFPSAALGTASVISGLLVVGAVFADLRADIAGPPVSVLFGASAFLAGAVARTGEHRVVQALFVVPRLLLVLVAVAALVAAAVLAFDLGRDAIATTWDVAAVAALLATLGLAGFWTTCRPSVRKES